MSTETDGTETYGTETSGTQIDGPAIDDTGTDDTGTDDTDTAVMETGHDITETETQEHDLGASDHAEAGSGAEAGSDGSPESSDGESQDASSQDNSQDTPTHDATQDTDQGERPTKPSRREALEAEGDVAADFLEALLDIADIVGDIDVDIDGDRAAVSIVDSEEGRVPRRLVGPDGRVLEALQELTRLAVQSETGERSRLMLDVAGHRAGRRTEIIEIARGAIAQVEQTGEQVDMDPMTAFERKIVHDEVLAAGLRSESEGVEPHRYVVVLPRT